MQPSSPLRPPHGVATDLEYGSPLPPSEREHLSPSNTAASVVFGFISQRTFKWPFLVLSLFLVMVTHIEVIGLRLDTVEIQKPLIALSGRDYVPSNGRWDEGPLVDWQLLVDKSETVPVFIEGNKGMTILPWENGENKAGCATPNPTCAMSFFKYPETSRAETFVSPPRSDGTRHRGYGRLLKGRHAEMPVDVHIMMFSVCSPLGAIKRLAIRHAMALIDVETYRVAYYWIMNDECVNSYEDWTFNQTVKDLFYAENRTYGDMHAVPRHFRNPDLLGKIQHEWKYHAAAKQATHLFKLDDDIIVIWDVLLRELVYEKPPQGVAWFREGTGRQGIYANGPYLVSLDVATKVAANTFVNVANAYDDDWAIGTFVTGSGCAYNLVLDKRWHNDDRGDPRQCLCFPFTLQTVAEGKTLVAHHIKPWVIEAWATNKTLFSLLDSYPNRKYATCENKDPAFLC